jgi:hypothetical protein
VRECTRVYVCALQANSQLTQPSHTHCSATSVHTYTTASCRLLLSLSPLECVRERTCVCVRACRISQHYSKLAHPSHTHCSVTPVHKHITASCRMFSCLLPFFARCSLFTITYSRSRSCSSVVSHSSTHHNSQIIARSYGIRTTRLLH